MVPWGEGYLFLRHVKHSNLVSRQQMRKDNSRLMVCPPGEYYVVAMDVPGMLPPEVILRVGTRVSVADGATAASLKLTTRDELKALQLQ